MGASQARDRKRRTTALSETVGRRIMLAALLAKHAILLQSPHWADGGSATDTLPCYGAARDVVILPKAPSLISRRNLILSL